MKGTRFSEEQIIGVLREHEAGARTEEVRLAPRDLERDVLQVESEVRRARGVQAPEETPQAIRSQMNGVIFPSTPKSA